MELSWIYTILAILITGLIFLLKKRQEDAANDDGERPPDYPVAGRHNRRVRNRGQRQQVSLFHFS